MTHNSQLLDGMVVFTEVVNRGGFLAAAESLGHSSSFISKEVSKLESRLGVRLLNRTTRSVGLTPEGKIYYEQCQQSVEDAQSSLELLNLGSSESRGTLKISCPISFGFHYLAPSWRDSWSATARGSLDLNLSDRKVDLVAESTGGPILSYMPQPISLLTNRFIVESQAAQIITGCRERTC